MAPLDPRQKAERIVELFRGRRPTEILPAEFYPANLEEAYAIRRSFQEIEEATGRGAIAGYKIGLTTPVMQQLCGIAEPCYGAIFVREVHERQAARHVPARRSAEFTATGGPLEAKCFTHQG